MNKIKFKQTETCGERSPEQGEGRSRTIGSIPEGWEPSVFSEAISVNPRRALTKGTEAKYISMADLKEDNKKIQAFITRKYSGGSKFINGDTLMARITPCLENGKTAFVDILNKDEVGSGSTEFIILAAKSDRTNEQYVYYLAISPGIQEKAIKSMTGTSGRQRVEIDVFGKIEINLPSLNEQYAIAKILSDLDEKIELNYQMNKTLESISQAIFKQWFVEFEPWGGEQPDDWQSYTLGDISVLSAGGDRPKVYSEKLSITCTIPIYSNGIDNDGLYGYTNSAKIIDESVTVSARGTIGFTCLRQVPYFPIVRLISLVPNQGYLSAKYLYLWLKNINISGTGTTQQQLTVPDFKKTEILIPTPEIMKRFTIVADSIFAQITANKNENTSITAIRDSLLPRLMSGRVRVSGG